MTRKDMIEFTMFLKQASDRQIQGIYDKEASAGRWEYVGLVLQEALIREVEIDTGK